MRDQVGQNNTQSVGKDFSDYFVACIAEGDWSKLGYFFRGLYFWDQGYHCTIYLFNQLWLEEDLIHKHTERAFNGFPVLL